MSVDRKYEVGEPSFGVSVWADLDFPGIGNESYVTRPRILNRENVEVEANLYRPVEGSAIDPTCSDASMLALRKEIAELQQNRD